MRPHHRPSHNTLVVPVRGWTAPLLLLAILSVPYLLSLRYPLTAEDATAVIRHYFRYQSSQRYAELYRSGKIDARASQRYRDERAEIDRLRFESVEIGRLLPDYLLSALPTYYVKAVIRHDDGRLETRYFNLGRGSVVIEETPELRWAFVL